MRDVRISLCVGAILFSTGCYQSHFQGGLTTLPSAQPQADLVVVDMLRDETSVAELLGERFLDRVETQTSTIVEQSGVGRRVLEQRDVGTTPTENAFLVRFELAEFDDRSTVGMGRVIAAGMAMFIIPLFFINAGPAVHLDVETRWQMRVYDIRGLTPTSVRDPDTGELVASFDVSMLTPLLRREYEVRLRGGVAARDFRSEDRRDEVMQAAADELATRLVSGAVEDIARAIGNAPPPAVVAPASVLTQAPTESY
jgi:hypothetical protein